MPSSQSFLEALNTNYLGIHVANEVTEVERLFFQANFLICISKGSLTKKSAAQNIIHDLESSSIRTFNALALNKCDPQARYLNDAVANVISTGSNRCSFR